MASTELFVALVALVVSVIALFIASLQLLAELFATAEGRRKTSEQVMGPFGKLTVREKKLLFKELRYEVYYTSPRLALWWTYGSQAKEKQIYRPASRIHNSLLVEMDKSLEYASFYPFGYVPITEYTKGEAHLNEGWQVLLASIDNQISGPDARSVAAGVPELRDTRPGVILQEWAWDMLPDDVGKAIASTTLSDILVIARRLGAVWTTSDKSVQNLRAEGNGHVFTSTNLRGLGAAIAYQRVGTTKGAIRRKFEVTSAEEDTHRRILQSWTIQADKFMFGICPGNPDFDVPDFIINDRIALQKTWNDHEWLEIPLQRREYGKETERNKENKYNRGIRWSDLFANKDDVQLRHATNDLIALACPMLRTKPQPKTFQRQVLLPFSGNIENMFQGLDRDFKAREVFLKRLEEEPKMRNTPDLQPLVSILSGLATQVPPDDTEASNFLDRAHDGFQWTTTYFKKIEARGMDQFYWHLMRAHLSRSPFVHGEAVRNWKNGDAREKMQLELAQRSIRCEQVHILFDSIHYFQDFMKGVENANFDDAELIKEAWIVLFFRGMCWSLCHTADELGEFLPVEFYASQMPIFLL